MRHTFESGAWVEVLPIGDLRVKHKDRLRRAQHYGTPFGEDGIDWAAVDARPGGRRQWSMDWEAHQRNVVLALILQDWSYPAPKPVLADDDELLNEDSIGEADFELEYVAEPYLAKLTKEKPDPKAVTTSSSSGPSPAAPASPTA